MTRTSVLAMIASAGISLLIMAFYGERTIPSDISHPDYVALAIFVIGFLVLRKWKLNPLYIMAGAGVAGMFLYTIF